MLSPAEPIVELVVKNPSNCPIGLAKGRLQACVLVREREYIILDKSRTCSTRKPGELT